MLHEISNSCVAIMFRDSILHEEELDIVNADHLTYTMLQSNKCNFQAVASALGRYCWERDLKDNYLRDKNAYCRDARIVDLLHSMGAQSASDFAALGMDCVDLNEIAWLERLIILFGKAQVVEAFLKTPLDAERLSATIACRILDVTLEQLLMACSGSPTNAYNILKLYDTPVSVKDLPDINALLNTGLSVQQMEQVGISRLSIMMHHSATSQQIDTMGPMIGCLNKST